MDFDAGCLRQLDGLLWPGHLTFDLQGLTRSRSSVEVSEYSLQVSLRLLKPFMRYRGNKICPEDRTKERTNERGGRTARKHNALSGVERIIEPAVCKPRRITTDLEVNESRSHSLYVTGEQLCATQDFTQSRQRDVYKLHGFDGIVALEHDKRVDRRLGAATSATLTTRQRRQLGVDQVLSLHHQHALIFHTHHTHRVAKNAPFYICN